MNAFYRVVNVGFLLPSNALAALSRPLSAKETHYFGKRAAVAARFESKPGGGGHIAFFREDRPEAVDRIVIEPHARGWAVAAYVTDASSRRADDALVEQIRLWLFDLFGIRPSDEPAGNGSATTLNPVM